jgi:hypothetical protein
MPPSASTIRNRSLPLSPVQRNSLGGPPLRWRAWALDSAIAIQGSIFSNTAAHGVVAAVAAPDVEPAHHRPPARADAR